MPASSARRGGSARDNSYTLVIADGSTGYVAPHAPECPDEERYLAVRRTLGSGWGIVDRRTGRLLSDSHPDQHRYSSWEDARQMIRTLNAGRGTQRASPSWHDVR
jgi:hypothetical protein